MNPLGKAARFVARQRFSTSEISILFILILMVSMAAHIVKLIPVWNSELTGDPVGYVELAKSLSLSNLYTSAHREPGLLWVIGISVNLGKFFGLTAAQSVRVSSVLQSVCIPFATFFFARVWVKDGAAILAAFFVAVNPFLTTFAVSGVRDILFILLFLVICVLVFSTEKPTLLRLVLIGSLGGLLCLVRLNAIFLFPVITLLGMVNAQKNRAIRSWVVIQMIAFLIILPALISYWQTQGDPLYPLNVHTRVFQNLDHRMKTGSSFWHYYFVILGPWELIKIIVKSLVDVFFGHLAQNSFFSSQNLPFPVFALYFGAYLLGLGLGVANGLWLPFAISLLLIGPWSPILAIGGDPRLVVTVVPISAIFWGLGVAWILSLILSRLTRFSEKMHYKVS